jgi:hypothetical protein
VTCYLPSEGRISGFLFGDQCTEDDMVWNILVQVTKFEREREGQKDGNLNKKRASACEIFYFNNVFSDPFLFIYL